MNKSGMRYIADHDFHIHSTVSLCCHDENQTPEAILSYAKENFEDIITQLDLKESDKFIIRR